MIQLVLFDLGNVLVNHDLPKFYRTVSAETGINPSTLAAQFRNEVLEALESGRMKMPAYIEHYRALWGLDWDEARWTAEGASLFTLNETGDRLRRQLQSAGFPTAVLSNLAPYNRAGVQMTFPTVLEGHQRIFTSYDIGAMKPDLLVYRTVVASLGLPPESILFLDDLASNVAGASAAGITARQFVPANYDAIEAEIQGLVATAPVA